MPCRENVDADSTRVDDIITAMVGGTYRWAMALSWLGLVAMTLANQTTDTSRSSYGIGEPDQAWVEQTLKNMSLRDKIAQMIQVRVPGKFLNRRSQEFIEIEREIRQNHVGGVVLFAGNVYESAVLLNELQSSAQVPLLVASDFERGASFRITDTTSFPWTMAIGATGSEHLAYEEGAVTAREARALGVHWIFAPVLDVNNNPDNPVINIRSFGEDPQLVARLGSAFIRGAHDSGVLTTAKHFPGHGDTATDSHLGLPVVQSDQARLDAIELVPFRSAVAAGVDSIMTAHVAVPQITGDATLPATLSPQILTQLLRQSLRFQGLIVTDALEMGGITNHYWSGLAAIRALEAGADILLLPTDTNVAINEVERAVKRGEISEARLNESVVKVLAAKTRLGLHLRRTAPIEDIHEAVATPESEALARDIADHSITLVKDNAHLVPIDPRLGKQLFSLVLSSELDPNPGAAFQAEMRRRFPGTLTAGVDTRTPDDVVASIMRNAARADVIVCATLVRLTTGQGKLSLSENQHRLLDKILALGKPVIWIAFGNPYVLRFYPETQTYICAFSYSEVSQVAAAKALSGAIGISGRMPVSIPGHAQAGAGLRIPMLDMTLKPASPAAGLQVGTFAEATRLLNSLTEQGVFLGASLVVGLRGAIVLESNAGRLDPAPESPPVTAETLYDLGSLSKTVATTSGAMMLVDSGRLLLDASVQDYLPEFQGTNKDRVKVRDLLAHSAGLQKSLPDLSQAQPYEEAVKQICSMPLEFEPHARIRYSDLGMILLGEIVARAAGHPLDRFVTDRLFEPLGMKSTMFRPPRSLWQRIASTEAHPLHSRVVDDTLQGENAWIMGGAAGHAGLFSNAHDLAVLAQMLLNRGIYDHRRYLSPETIALFTATQGVGTEIRGLGWAKPTAGEVTKQLFTSGAYGDADSTGKSLWIDPQRKLFIVLLANASQTAGTNSRVEEARRSLTEVIARAIAANESNR